jgi:hypothetical protein
MHALTHRKEPSSCGVHYVDPQLRKKGLECAGSIMYGLTHKEELRSVVYIYRSELQKCTENHL